jgi:hypothetical protein
VDADDEEVVASEASRRTAEDAKRTILDCVVATASC